jgi:aarF domain-containing kinase
LLPILDQAPSSDNGVQIIDNFIHADLHPGNIIVQLCHSTNGAALRMEDILEEDRRSASETGKTKSFVVSAQKVVEAFDNGYCPKLVYIDAGLVTELTDQNLQNFIDLFSAVADGDGELAGKLMVERSRSKTCLNYSAYLKRMQTLVAHVQRQTFRLATISISDILGDVLSMVRQHHVKIESDFTNLVVSIMVLEGLGRRLDRDVDLFEAARPFLRYRQKEFYTDRRGLFFKLSAFLEARAWLRMEWTDSEYGVIDILSWNNH